MDLEFVLAARMDELDREAERLHLAGRARNVAGLPDRIIPFAAGRNALAVAASAGMERLPAEAS